MMRIHEHRCRSATFADLLENLAVRYLRKSMTTSFFRSGHSEHADPAQTIDHIARDIGLSIYRVRIELPVERLAQIGQDFVEFSLLVRRNLRIRHHPIGNESSQKEAFGETKHLWSSEEKFFGLLNLLLTLNFGFVHKN